jgi:hypothetical protein
MTRKKQKVIGYQVTHYSPQGKLMEHIMMKDQGIHWRSDPGSRFLWGFDIIPLYEKPERGPQK